MKATITPLMVALAVSSTGLALNPTLAQLPPASWGHTVKMPGDNQYSQETQQTRHGGYAPAQTRPTGQTSVTMSDYRPTPPPQRPDISLDPIAAEEPIPKTGFPPMPDRLDLPVSTGGWTPPATPWAPPGGTAGRGNAQSPLHPSFHQHYGHVPAGAYVQRRSDSMPPDGGGHGYYRARSPSGDYYNSNTPGGSPSSGAGARDLRALGREPRLNSGNDSGASPGAPTPVVVTQSHTQDLSLPEDQFNYRQGTRGRKHFTTPYLIRGPLNSVGGLTGVRF